MEGKETGERKERTKGKEEENKGENKLGWRFVFVRWK